MKIKSLRLKDVMCHADSSVELGERLTVLTGVSDSGKSVVMRALNQLFRNRPAGIDLLRHGAKRGSCSEVSAEAIVDGAVCSIVRRRGKSKNEYEIDGQTLLAIGKDVPEEVAGKAKLSPFAFQLQSDGHFLLNETDGTVAGILSATVGLSQIDAAFSKVRGVKQTNDGLLRQAQSDSEREDATLEKFCGLEEAEKLSGKASEISQRLFAASEAAADSSALLSRIAAARSPCPAEELSAARSCNTTFAVKQEDFENIEKRMRAASSLFLGFSSTKKSAVVQLAVAMRLLKVAEKKIDENIAAAEKNVEACALRGSLLRAKADAKLLLRKATLYVSQATDVTRLYDTLGVSALKDARRARELADDIVLRREDAANGLRSAEELCLSFTSSQEILREADLRKGDAAELCDRLNLRSSTAESLAEQISAVETEIADYLKKHPVCAECGAEQKHWKINKKG